MTPRIVRFSASFFDRLDDLLPDSRTDDGTPSATDFLLYDLAPARDLLALDYEGNTQAVPPGHQVRAFVGSGLLVSRFALFVTMNDDGSVEVLDVEIELEESP